MIETVLFRPMEEFKTTASRVFNEQKNRIMERLPFVQIEHIAGTSVPGLLTKGDLDINIRVSKKDFDNSTAELKRMYEINQPDNWTDTYASFKDEENLDIDFGVQLTVINSPDDYFLKHRDALLASKELVNKLNDLKRRYEGKPMEEYRKAKGEFFSRLS